MIVSKHRILWWLLFCCCPQGKIMRDRALKCSDYIMLTDRNKKHAIKVEHRAYRSAFCLAYLFTLELDRQKTVLGIKAKVRPLELDRKIPVVGIKAKVRRRRHQFKAPQSSWLQPVNVRECHPSSISRSRLHPRGSDYTKTKLPNGFYAVRQL
jgi:hypothetical protein